MRKTTTILLLFIIAISFYSFNTVITFSGSQTINSIIGDKSFVAKFGYMPIATTNEALRIKTHLAYVENLLRQKDVAHLTKKEQRKRNHLLNLLHKYWTAGNFPCNYDIANQRKPCFIDKNGTICAVGYLVAQTVGLPAAEKINSTHKYEHIYEMKDTDLDIWLASSGLTKEECAMIQPNYGPVVKTSYISYTNGITTALLGGINLSLNSVNGVQIANGAGKKAVPIIGIITGAAQAIFGVATLPIEYQTNGTSFTNQGLTTLCFVNIGLGTSTMLLSTWNLMANRIPTNKPTAFNLFSYPTSNKSVGLAFSVRHRFCQ
jgi:hypothetical protein